MYTPFKATNSNNRLLIVDWASLGYQTIFSLESEYKKSKRETLWVENQQSNFYRNVGVELDMSSPESTVLCYRNSHFSRMLDIINTFNPHKILISLEGGRNWRYDAYPEYKMNRRDKKWPFVIMPREFDMARVDLAKDVGNLFGAHVLQYRGCEGDDIVAVSTKRLVSMYDNITIVSSDADLLQLKKYNNVDVYDPKVRDYKDCPDGASTFLECKVLSGDDSDNIKGILLPGKKRRLGKKTAVKIYNSCEGDVYTLAEEAGWLDQYLLNKKLIDMEYIPESITSEIENLIRNSKREFVDYIGAMEMGFTKMNMQKYSNLMSRGLHIFNQSVNGEYLYDERY